MFCTNFFWAFCIFYRWKLRICFVLCGFNTFQRCNVLVLRRFAVRLNFFRKVIWFNDLMQCYWSTHTLKSFFFRSNQIYFFSGALQCTDSRNELILGRGNQFKVFWEKQSFGIHVGIENLPWKQERIWICNERVPKPLLFSKRKNQCYFLYERW